MRFLYLILQLMVALTKCLTHADTLSGPSSTFLSPLPAALADISNLTSDVSSEATNLPVISAHRIKTSEPNNTATNDIDNDNSDYYDGNSARDGAPKGFGIHDKEVVDQLIKQWAPVVWLAPEEKFMPLGVEEFLNHVHPSDRDRSFIPGMPIGDDSKKAFLVTNAQVDELLENQNSFIYGRNPNESPVPIYAVVKLCNDQPNKIDSPEVSIALTRPTSSPTLSSTPPMQQLKDKFEPSSAAFSTRGPYIPVSFNPLDERIYTVRRSSRFYPAFKRIRRSAAAKPATSPPQVHLKTTATKIPIQSYELVMGEMNVGGSGNIDNTKLATTIPPEINEFIPVNNFIANLADNVKFSPQADELDNNINFESSYNEPKHPAKYNKRQKLPSFHVTYWMFYPYSQGKTMCTLNLGPLGSIPFPAVYGFCLGRRKDIGSHIGDWEHMSLFFSSSTTEPSAMYVSAHDAGAYYTYNRLTGSFEFKKQETRKGILQRPNFPKTVTTFNNHPVLFAAKGSHGLWTAPGKHRFVKVARLYDINGFGTPWNTWNAIDITYANKKSFGRSLMHSWLFFKGKWGNPKTKCHPFRRIGLNFCEYTDGPTGIPLKEPHFQCGVTYR